MLENIQLPELITEEMIQIVNDIRKSKGCVDLVGDKNYEVYYRFFVDFDWQKRSVTLSAVCCNGLQDDEQEYILPLTESDREILLFKIIQFLLDEY